MARPRFDKLSPDRQRTILAAAETEFGAHGYSGASLNRIIATAGLSKGVFYYYFDDKADLAATIFEHATRDAIGSAEGMKLPEGRFDFWKFFEELLKGTIETLRTAPRQSDALSRLGMAFIHDPALSARLMAALRDFMRLATRFWRRGQEMGAVRSDIPAELLVTVLQGAKEGLARAYLPSDRAPTRSELDRFVEMQLDLFRRVAGPRPQTASRRNPSAPRRPKARSGRTVVSGKGQGSADNHGSRPRARQEAEP